MSAGADGLLKLWSCRTGECGSTFDEHAGKIWALAAAGPGEGTIATGEEGGEGTRERSTTLGGAPLRLRLLGYINYMMDY